VALNLGGGYKEFLALAKKLNLPDADKWVMGRPAQHPMKELADFFRCADALVQSSLEEGLALSTLEGMASGTPVIASAVGGMAVTLPGYARLTPRQDHEAVARELLWIAQNRAEARAQALRGREMVAGSLSRKHAFAHWGEQFRSFQKPTNGN
jgi:glycosyltransferase involved in cell wall biosynthesis